AAVAGALGFWNDRHEPADRVELGPGLLDAVLEGVPAAGSPELEPIEAAHLQLVLERLWEEEGRRDSHVLRVATLAELGGPGGLAGDHARRALDALGEDERRLAGDLLDHLVSPTGESLTQPARALAGWANVDDAVAVAVLGRLAGERVVRPAGEDRWRIYHDV